MTICLKVFKGEKMFRQRLTFKKFQETSTSAITANSLLTRHSFRCRYSFWMTSPESVCVGGYTRNSLILRRPGTFAATLLPLFPSPSWYTLCEVVFMTSEPFVNFHQSERMYLCHIPRSVESMECNSKWKVLSRLRKPLAKFLEWKKKLFSE